MRKLVIFFFIVFSMCLNLHSASAALTSKTYVDSGLQTKQDKIPGSPEIAGSVIVASDTPGQVGYTTLGTSAYSEYEEFATADQGAKADTAIQPTGGTITGTLYVPTPPLPE